jgi:mannose-6-phosphate isomerase
MSHVQGPHLFERAWRMSPDNFTPPVRTPWGGRVILDRIKRGLPLSAEKRRYPVVGESWEISVEPSFPSRIVGLEGSPRLDHVISLDPEAALGRSVAGRFHGCPLLVKLLDAKRHLSVQVHPSDEYSGLRPDESGKPESWVVVAREPGAGLYLGLADGVEEGDVRTCLDRGDDLSRLLNFVPVEVGDCFEIAARTVHAVGPGVTLVEPQQVTPGRIGVTYRFWDWNRRYDAAGRDDPSGQPRPLHVEQSLAATDFGGLRGRAFVDSLRRDPTPVQHSGQAVLERLIRAEAFTVERARGTGRLTVETDRLLGAVVLDGRIDCHTPAGVESFQRGEAFVLPAAVGSADLDLHDALAILARPGAPSRGV